MSDLSPDYTELLRLHEQQRTAHLTKNADLFVSMFHDPMWQLNGGRIVSRSTEENRGRVQTYFDAVQFLAWDDLELPIIRISADGTMASIIVNKRVHLTYQDENGATQEEITIFAWMEAWEKLDGRWQLIANASTNRPGTS